jgi:hypothetical protein
MFRLVVIVVVKTATLGIKVMINILTIDSEYDSACRLGFKTTTYINKHAEDFDNEINIRWGNSHLLLDKENKEVDFKNVINPGLIISANCRKHEALKKMSAVVHTPKMFEEAVPDGLLVVVRPVEHAGGSGFSVKNGPLTLEKGHEYATQYIKTKTEYRVWFINGKTLCAKRVCSKDKSKYPCRSEWGYSL